ncbi:MAG: hypothetical protein PHD15_01790 [Clostridia bacterium]|nr:hypothetical protein [Clostridia bacterium]MDD4386483.1 hypothetical protein [Clostridia bacterium]
MGNKTFKETSYATAYTASDAATLLLDNDFNKIKTIEQLKTKYNN